MGPHLVVEERNGEPSVSLQLSRDREEGEDSRRDIPIVVSWKAIDCGMFRECRPYWCFPDRVRYWLSTELVSSFNTSLPGRGRAQRTDRMCLQC